MTIPRMALDRESFPDHFLYRFADLEIKTDRWDREQDDRVLGLGGSVHVLINYLWHHPELVRGRIFFEPFAGSGPLGFLALRLGAEHATLLDINPRAIEFMRHNAARNGFDASRYAIRQGDIRAFAPERAYHLIAANPPFVPVPEGVGFPIHSNGGEDGNVLTRVLLRQLGALLAQDGEALLTTFQIEDDNGPLLVHDVEALVRNRPVEFARRRKASFVFDEMASEYEAVAPHRRSAIARWSEKMKTKHGSRLRFNYYVVHVGKRNERPTQCTISDCDVSKYGAGFSLDDSKSNLIGGEIRAFAERRAVEQGGQRDAAEDRAR